MISKASSVDLVRFDPLLTRSQNTLSLPASSQPDRLSQILQLCAPKAWHLRQEIEEQIFRLTQPDHYHAILEAVGGSRRARYLEIQRVVSDLQNRLGQQAVRARVGGRPKRIHSIHYKMTRKGLSLDDIYDLRALRVIVEDEDTCYRVLDMIHRQYSPVPNTFDNYIAQPKSNGYRSLHTAVVDGEGRALEIQIRTQQMHQIAENGSAAHWRYKLQKQSAWTNGRLVLDRTWTTQCAVCGGNYLAGCRQTVALGAA